MPLFRKKTQEETDMPPPPPFFEKDQFTDVSQLPPYETPRYNEPPDNSTRLVSATRKFPPALNGYFSWKSLSTFHLGPSGKERLFTLGLHCGIFSGQPPMILYDGPTDKDPVLATSKTEKHIMSRHLQINIPPRSQNPNGTSIPFNSCARTFLVFVPGPHKESMEVQFEWRRSHGSEIKDLAGNSYGWKLVRSKGPAVAAGGSRQERTKGTTSDGKEILAVFAYSISASITKALKFAFMGEGLTGILGEEWEIAAVISGLWLWFLDTQVFVATTAAS